MRERDLRWLLDYAEMCLVRDENAQNQGVRDWLMLKTGRSIGDHNGSMVGVILALRSMLDNQRNGERLTLEILREHQFLDPKPEGEVGDGTQAK